MSEVLTATLFELTDGCESLKNDCVFSIAIPCPANLRGKDPNTLHFVLKIWKDLAFGVGRLLRSEAAHIKRQVLDREAEPGDEDLPLAKGLYTGWLLLRPCTLRPVRCMPLSRFPKGGRNTQSPARWRGT